jgi:hypothetical protein
LSRSGAKTVPERAKEVLSYFLRNPQAADSLEGVARWRLMEQRVHGSVEETDETLAWLVSQGFLLEESPVGAAPLFRLNRAQAAQAERFVAQHRDPTTGDDAETTTDDAQRGKP